MTDEMNEFHKLEYTYHREEVGRIQLMRAQIERLALGLILAIWAWLGASVAVPDVPDIHVLGWWLPVICCAFVIQRLRTFQRSLRNMVEYQLLIENKYADPTLRGWLTWLRSETREIGDKRGMGLTMFQLWNGILALSIAIALVGTVLDIAF